MAAILFLLQHWWMLSHFTKAVVVRESQIEVWEVWQEAWALTTCTTQKSTGSKETTDMCHLSGTGALIYLSACTCEARLSLFYAHKRYVGRFLLGLTPKVSSWCHWIMWLLRASLHSRLAVGGSAGYVMMLLAFCVSMIRKEQQLNWGIPYVLALERSDVQFEGVEPNEPVPRRKSRRSALRKSHCMRCRLNEASSLAVVSNFDRPFEFTANS